MRRCSLFIRRFRKVRSSPTKSALARQSRRESCCAELGGTETRLLVIAHPISANNGSGTRRQIFPTEPILETKTFNAAFELQSESRSIGRRGNLLLPVRAQQRAVRTPRRHGAGGHRRSAQAPKCLQANQQDCECDQEALSAFPKVLFTATPLQNSLLELYGLVSIVDEMTFGDLKSFRSQYLRLADDNDFASLRNDSVQSASEPSGDRCSNT